MPGLRRGAESLPVGLTRQYRVNTASLGFRFNHREGLVFNRYVQLSAFPGYRAPQQSITRPRYRRAVTPRRLYAPLKLSSDHPTVLIRDQARRRNAEGQRQAGPV